MMREAVPGYDNFEEATVAATGSDATAILELGTGTGETARAVLDKHPQAHLTTIDGSPRMVRVARENLPARRVDVVLGRLEVPPPPAVSPASSGGWKIRYPPDRSTWSCPPSQSTILKARAKRIFTGASRLSLLRQGISFLAMSSRRSIPPTSLRTSTRRWITRVLLTKISLGSKPRACFLRSPTRTGIWWSSPHESRRAPDPPIARRGARTAVTGRPLWRHS